MPLFLPNVLVMITRAGNEGTGGAQSYLLAKLSAGGSWTENINGVDITVTVESINTSTGDAVICVNQGGSACFGTAAPTPSPTTAAPTTPAPTPPPPSTPFPTNAPTPFDGKYEYMI